MSKLLDSLLESVRPAVLDRRSVLLLLEEEWHLRREEYWSRLFRAMEPSVSSISQTPFAESLTHLAAREDDLLPLTAAVCDSTRSSARRAYRFVCQFATAEPEVVAPDPWLRLCFDARSSQVEEVLAIAAQLLYRVIGRCELAPGLRAKAAAAARALLSSAWRQGLGPMALGAVIDTLDVSPVEGADVLRLLIDSPAEYPRHEEAMRLLARHVEHLFEAPDILARLYRNAVIDQADEEARRKVEFHRWYEAADAARRDGDEAPPAPSRARVNDQGVDYWLERHVGAFLERAPLVSVRAYVDAATYWERTTDVRDKQLPTVTLASAHGTFSIDARASDGLRGHPMSLVDHLLEALGPAIDAFPSFVREEVLLLLTRLPAPSSVWATLIQRAEISDIFRVELAPMIAAPSALRLFTKPIADLVRNLGDRLPASMRRSIAEGVALLSDRSDQYDKARLESALRTTETDSTGVSPPNGHDGVPSVDDDHDDDEVALVGSTDDVDDALDTVLFKMSREQLEQPANAAVRRATRAVWSEIQRLEPLRQKREDAVDILPDAIVALGALRAALRESNIVPPLEIAGWSAFAHLASLRAVLSGSSEGDSDIYEAATRTDGRAELKGDLLNAGQAFPRAEAIVGLMALAVREVRALVELERLAGDSEPAVRYQIAWRLGALSELGRDRVWPLLCRLARDANVSVAAAAIRELSAFYRLDQDAALALAIDALARFDGPTEGDHEGRTDALLQVAWYHLARANDVAGRAVLRAVDEISAHPVGIDRLMHSYRDWLVMTGDDEAEEGARLRTVDLFTRIGRACVASLPSGSQARVSTSQRSERDAHVNLVEDVATQLYFASGAFRAEESASPLSDEVISRFYLEIRDLLVEVGTCSVVLASNKVLETLEYFIGQPTANIDKKDALQRFLRVGENAVRSGAADSLWLLDPIENVLRRSVAERDPALTDDATLLAWSRILDPLINLGWEQAYRLARDLDVSR